VRTWQFTVDLPACHPGPGWWKKRGLPMPREVANKQNWRARKAASR
jgi:hypothetical protein